MRTTLQHITEQLAHGIQNVDNAWIDQPVNHGSPVTLGSHDVALAQNRQMPRHSRLRHVQFFGQGGYMARLVMQRINNLNPFGVAHRLADLLMEKCQLVHGWDCQFRASDYSDIRIHLQYAAGQQS